MTQMSAERSSRSGVPWHRSPVGMAHLAAGVFAIAVTLALWLASGAAAFVYWDSGGDYSTIATIVGRANLDGSGGNLSFIPGASNPCGVAVDAHYIYWAIGRGAAIARANLDGSNVNESFITGVTDPCGVAVDGQHIYWANGGADSGVHAGSAIGRANLDGSSVDQSFITGAANPDAIAVDGTYIYWANRGPEYAGNATIGRAKLDGTSVNESFITGASNPCGIAVDGAHVYWTNQPVVVKHEGGGETITYETNTIGRANLNGTSPNQSFIAGPPGIPSPPRLCGLAVDSAHLYWTLDESFGAFVPSIGRANLDGSGVNESFINVAGGGAQGATGVAVDSLVPSTTALTPSPGSIIFGQPMSFTAAVTRGNPPEGSSTPTGKVSFTVAGEPSVQVPLDGNGQASLDLEYYLNVGDTVSAKYGGDSAYGESGNSLTPTIQAAHTMTSLTASPNPQTSSGDVTLIATVDNLSTAIVPFGSVEFLIDGELLGPPVPLDVNGQAGIDVSGFDPGDHAVVADYHEDTHPTPDFTDSQASLTEHITSAPAPPKPPASPAASLPLPPPAPPFQGTLSAVSLRLGIRDLLRGAFSDSVTLTGSGSVTQDLFAEGGVLPATATRVSAAGHKKSKRLQSALLLAKGSARTTAAGTVKVTLRPTTAGKKALKTTHRSLRAVLITSVKDSRTGRVTNLPPQKLTLRR